jgi:hypothetical protein
MTQRKPIVVKHPEERLADDLIWGIRGPHGIAAFLGIDVRRAYYLIQRGAIPTKKIGHRTIVASRSRLRALLASHPKLSADEDRAVTERGASDAQS